MESLNKNSGPTLTDFLKVLIAVHARIAWPEATLREILSPLGNSAYIRAYNLCDGKRAISEIAKQVGLDRSNLHKAVLKWADAGVIFRTEHEELPLGLYRLALADDLGTKKTRKISEPDLRAGEQD